MIKISPESTFKFVKLCVIFTCAWPPNKNASRSDMIIFEIKWWILWFNSLYIAILWIHTTYFCPRDVFILTECLLFTQLFVQNSLKMYICKMQYKQIQFFIEEMESYFNNASAEDREIFVDYVKKYGIANFAFMTYAFCSTLEFMLGPLFSSQLLPFEINYPFEMESTPLLQIIYIQNLLTGCQVVSAIGIDNQVSFMIWCVVIRFEIFRRRLSKISNANEFKIFIQGHQYLLWLARETVNISRFVIFTTLVSSVLIVILSGVLLIGNQPITVRLTSLWLLMARCILLLLHTIPSEFLLESCEGISFTIYECDWVDSPIRKDIAFVIFQSHNPVTISIPGFLPKLSLRYYTMFLSKSFSFFTTLRIVLSKINSETIK